MRRVAASGPIIGINTAEGTAYLRSSKTAEQFATTLPRNMGDEKRARIMRTHYPKA